MSTQGLQYHVSSRSGASTDNNLRVLAQDVQRVFRIPHKVILDMLLGHLGPGPAQYERVVHANKRMRVTIHFNTAALDLGDSIIDVFVPGEYCTDENVVQDNVA